METHESSLKPLKLRDSCLYCAYMWIRYGDRGFMHQPIFKYCTLSGTFL